MTYCDGDDGMSAIVSVQCGLSDELLFIDENPVNVYNFQFKTYGACWKVS